MSPILPRGKQMQLPCWGYPALFAAACCVLTSGVHAQDLCQEPVGRFASIDGEADVRNGGGGWRAAQLDQRLCEGDTIRVGDRSRVAVQLINTAVLRVDQNTSVRLVNLTGETQDPSCIDLITGAFHAFSRQPWLLKVTTPHLKGKIDGTEFLVQVDEERSLLSVFEGRVLVSNDRGRLPIAPGEAAIAEAGRAPERRILIRPRDAVQWALYYPPLLTVPGGSSGRIPLDAPPALRAALEHADRGDSGTAFGALDRIAEADRDARYYVYRAALLLSVGRVIEARADINRTLEKDPDAGLAYALRAVIHVVQNQGAQALADAERGVALNPTAAAKIALSYALQAHFRIEAARDTLRTAVEQHPDDPLAWARLGELLLMLGDRREARAAADKAAALAPDLARTELVLGFTALAEFHHREAMAAFERAIVLDSADPLAHLGRGLAKVSEGDVVRGRQDIEVAVGLDANSALLRAYLGKAYFEERRYPLDARQYGIAKSLDPADPTAYLYEGILNQTVNRPVEAVRELRASLERNDDRAVYRSRLLLDKDRAARETSLSRAYQDLGFTQLGIRQAADSLGIDPTNYSAHRFLSDSYLGVRRREIARVSELLQAQLLQDININPIQPSVAETNLNIVTIGGPATPGFNEFTPLFEQNMVQLEVTGFGGNNDAYGGEGVITALYDRFSFSAGGYHYNSDGWRDNNALTEHILDVFAQAAITPELNFQAEFRRRESEEGDLAFNFDPDNFLLNKTVKREQDTVRVGLRYSPEPRSNFLFSFIHGDRDEHRVQSDTGLDLAAMAQPTAFVNSQLGDDGDQFEGQYLYQRNRFNLVAGLAYSDVDSRSDAIISFIDIDSGSVDTLVDFSKGTIIHPRGYLYTNINFPIPVTWTLGFSYDDYEENAVAETSFNPKFGVQWWATKDLRLRAAAFKTLKPALVNNRTIEPTQVAGFNQFFDDIDATKSWRYGGGFDWQLTRDLSLGGEVTWRDLDEPIVLREDGIETAKFEDREERYHFLDLYWAPMTRLGVTAQFVYDRYTSEEGIATQIGNLPEKVVTISSAIGATYFHPSGFFARLGGSFVHQDVKRSELAVQGQGSDSFFLVDAAVGYRLPKRFGLVSLGVTNLLDTDFEYQDDSYREFRDESSIGPYFPDRIFLARFSLNM